MGLIIAGLALGIIILVIFAITTSRAKMKEAAAKEQERQRKEAAEKLLAQQLEDDKWEFPLSEFKKKCTAQKLESVESEADYQCFLIIARQILKKYKVSEKYHHRYISKEAAESYFETLEEKEEQKRQKQQATRIKNLEKKEQLISEELVKYSCYTGNDKSVRYCKDKMKEAQAKVEECERKLAEISSKAAGTYTKVEKKEQNWAVHGGIADAVAGPAAGVVVAADIMEKNAEARKHNSEMLRMSIELAALESKPVKEERDAAKKAASKWKKQAEKDKLALIEEKAPAELMKALVIKSVKQTVGATGAVTLSARVSTPEGVKVFDEPGVIDGNFKAILSADGNKAGEAIFVLPYKGAPVSGCTVKAMCLKPSIKAEKYTVTFEAGSLWVTETKR